MASLLKILWNNFSFKRKIQASGLVLFSILTSIFEVLTVGSIFHLLSYMTRIENNTKLEFNQDFSQYLSLEYQSDNVFVIFIFFLILACVCRIFLLWLMLRFSHTIGNDMGTLMFLKILKQPMEYHFSITTSEIISGLTKKIHILSLEIVHPIILVSTNIIIISTVIFYLIFSTGVKIIFVFAALISLFYLFWLLTKSKIIRNSFIISKNSDLIVKIISDTLSAYKLISMKETYSIFTDKFGSINKKLKFAEGDNVFLSQSIRIWLELFIIIFGTIFCIISINSGVFFEIIPLLGGFVFAIYRIIPLVLKTYSGVATIMGARESFLDILNYLNLETKQKYNSKKHIPVNFKNKIEINNLTYKYPSKTLPSLNDINCTIKKGEITAIIGTTGSGKTTLLSLITGLISPTKGKVFIDQKHLNTNMIKNWQKEISYVPQETIVIDGSIKENVSLILNKKIDQQKLIEVLKITKLEKFIPNIESKEIMGERGIKLSGGERQRIGLARAVYDDKKIIILDEPFSALDKRTANMILRNLKNLKKFTILIVTHDRFVIPFCDKIITLNDGNTNYQEENKSGR